MHRFVFKNNQQFMNKLLPIVFVLLFISSACEKNENLNREFDYSFKNDTEGWQSFFSDYPQGSEAQYDLTFEYTTLPEPLDTLMPAIMISGINHSDDLLSFIYRKFDGLQPNKKYSVTFEVTFASNVQNNSIGIGGSPDLAFGVGGLSYEPSNTVDTDGWYRPNFVSRLQSRESNDTILTTGTIGAGEDVIDYTLIQRNNKNNPVMVTSNNKGELWLMMGTDSGFEGTTTLYYSSIKIKME